MRFLHGAAIASLAIGAVACHSRAAAISCAPKDLACVKAAQAKSVARSLSFWKSSLARPLSDRVGVASPEVVDFVALANLEASVPNKPRVDEVNPQLIQTVKAAIAELPASVRRIAERKLAGVMLIDDLGGSGFSDQIFDEKSQPVAGFIVLDAQLLQARAANAWATWKESTPFRPSPDDVLTARIESDANDSTRNAIQYILLHELGHVVSLGAGVHPPWNLAPKDVGSTAGYRYFNLSWTVVPAENRYASVFDAQFPERRDVAYYFGARLDAQQMATVYGKLQQTNFATLYSVNNPGDDFAEAFVNYVHVVLMHKPFEIRIAKSGATVMTYTACWDQPRCADKRKIIESLLAR